MFRSGTRSSPKAVFGVVYSLVSLLAPGLDLASPALAQAAPDPQVDPPSDSPAEDFGDEIVVTARRRKEDPQTVPISITAFDQAALEERSLVDLSDLGDFTPNLDFSTTGGFGDQASEASVTIRGLGQLDTALFADPAVGIYVDGIFLARAQGGVLDLLDLERVEVLRGPQGTLFGKNTTGGAISLITRQPSSGFAAQLGLSLGELDRRDFRGSLSGPLAEKLFGSLAFLATERDGFSRSLATGQEFHDDDRDAGRATLSYRPSPELSIRWTADATREREAGGNDVLLSLVPTDLLDFYNRSQIAGGFEPVTATFVTGNLFESHSTFPSFVDGDVYGSSLTLDWTASRALGLRSITGWRGFEFETSGDADGTPNPVGERTVRNRQDQLSQELHLTGLGADDRLTWLVGGLYFREEPREVADVGIMSDIFSALEAAPGPIVALPGVPAFLCDPGPPPPGVPCLGGAGNPFNLLFFNGFGGLTTVNLLTTSWAIFGEGTYDLSDRIRLTVGLRFSRDDKELDYENQNALGVVDSDLFNEDGWDSLTPRLSLAYRWTPETLFYFTASRGFKSGGFNGRPQQRQALDPYDPETLWSYEAGLKADLLDRRLRLNSSAFWSDYDDVQFSASLEVDGQPFFVIQNAGRAEIRGFELELEAEPGKGFHLSAGVGYLDTELVDLAPGVPSGVMEGGRLPKAPEWTTTAAVQYAAELGELGTLIARADFSHRSEVSNDIVNTPEIVQDGYGLLNARLLFAPSGDRWDIALFATNLTDEEYLEHGFFFTAGGFNIGIAGRPREWGLSAQLRF